MRRAARHFGLVAGGLGLLLLGWSYLSHFVVGPITLPPPTQVGGTLIELIRSGALAVNFAASIGVIFLGFTIGGVVGLPVGVLIGHSDYWSTLLLGPITVIANVPGLAYGVLMLAAFGLGPVGPTVATAMVAFPYVAINVAEGIKGVDTDLVRMSLSYGRSRLQIARHVMVPSVMPYLFASLRYAFAQGWKIAALVEVFGATNGIGFMIRSTYQSFSVDGMLAWTIAFVAFMLLIERVVLVQIEHRVFAWRPA